MFLVKLHDRLADKCPNGRSGQNIGSPVPLIQQPSVTDHAGQTVRRDLDLRRVIVLGNHARQRERLARVAR